MNELVLTDKLCQLYINLFTENKLIHSSSLGKIMAENETEYNSYYYPRDINVKKPEYHESNPKITKNINNETKQNPTKNIKSPTKKFQEDTQ